MLLAVIVLLVCLCSCSADTGSDKRIVTQSDLALELMSIKQLLNQESMYRLDLERQIRELREKSVTCPANKGISQNNMGASGQESNTSSSSLEKTIASEINSYTKQSMDKVLSVLSNTIDQKFEDMEREQINLSNTIDQRLEEMKREQNNRFETFARNFDGRLDAMVGNISKDQDNVELQETLARLENKTAKCLAGMFLYLHVAKYRYLTTIEKSYSFLQ